MTLIPKSLMDAAAEASAMQKDLDASITSFEAAVIRNSTQALDAATEHAHATLQRVLDAKAAVFAIARREVR